jgi:hypothetical protein
MRFVSLTARLAPLVLISIASIAGPRAFAAPETRPADDHAVVRLSPGRATFSMNANGEWTLFGVRGERALMDGGGVIVFTTRPNASLEERASSSRGGMHALLATGAIAPLSEGARGGARYPSMQPDDDNDGRVDEDVVDRIDNDGDGEVDEDFAAIGDEMVVGMYGTRGGDAVTIRQECYGWSLGHIDGMIASTIVINNTATKVMPGARIGIELKPSSGLELGNRGGRGGRSRHARSWMGNSRRSFAPAGGVAVARGSRAGSPRGDLPRAGGASLRRLEGRARHP